MWNSYIDQVVAINDIHSHRFLMWASPLVHDAIHMTLKSVLNMSIQHTILSTSMPDWQTNREQMKWNESGFRPPLCTYRLNWARRTSWGWWDDWDDTVLQTQDSKFEPWRSEAEHATSRSRRLPTILTFTRGWGRNNFFLLNRRDKQRTSNTTRKPVWEQVNATDKRNCLIICQPKQWK